MKNLYLANFSITMPGESSFLPYSVGNLWAYAKQDKKISEEYTLKNIFFEKDDIDLIFENIHDPDIFAFSVYIWNSNFSDNLAKKIKDKYPNCLIIYGGPHVPQDSNLAWYNNHNFIDVVVFYEGEENFKNILLNPKKEDISQRVNHAVNINGNWINNHSTSKSNRIKDLASYPSPYLDNFMPEPKKNHSLLFETNRGCPYMCTFCDWGSMVNSKISKHSMDRLKREIEYTGINKIPYLHMADANFGIFKERDIQITDWIIETKEKYGYPKYFFVNWAKNTNDTILEIAKKLYDAELIRGFNMSLQTLTEAALVLIKRNNMASNDYEHFSKKCNSIGLPFDCQLILGNPGETQETWKNTYLTLLKNNNMTTFIYPLALLPNAEMSTDESRRIFRFETTNVSFPGVGSQKIKEEMEIVINTDTMSNRDFKEIYKWTWATRLGHEYNITRDIAILLEKSKILSIFTFYNKFYDFIKTSSGPINKLYKDVNEQVEKNSFGFVLQKVTFRNQLTTTNRTAMYDEINEFLITLNIDSILRKNLIDYSDSRLFDRYKEYPYKKFFDYDFYNNSFKKKKILLEFTNSTKGLLNTPAELFREASKGEQAKISLTCTLNDQKNIDI
jgi:putative methyltransferase